LADLFIDIHQLIAEFPEALAFGDLALRFGQAGWGGKHLGDGLAVHFAGQAIVRAMAEITGLMAMTVRISTTAPSSGNGTRSHVAQLGDLGLNGGATAFQVCQRVGHVQPPIT
jgi:hypothetical protein